MLVSFITLKKNNLTVARGRSRGANSIGRWRSMLRALGSTAAFGSRRALSTKVDAAKKGSVFFDIVRGKPRF